MIEVPEGVKWHIGEYDGMEWIAEDHRQWGLDEYPKEQDQGELFPTIRHASKKEVEDTLEAVIQEHGELLSKIKD